jgi:hypothetical protein
LSGQRRQRHAQADAWAQRSGHRYHLPLPLILKALTGHDPTDLGIPTIRFPDLPGRLDAAVGCFGSDGAAAERAQLLHVVAL